MSANQKPEQYDPPEVEEIPSGDGPTVTAAGQSPPQDEIVPRAH